MLTDSRYRILRNFFKKPLHLVLCFAIVTLTKRETPTTGDKTMFEFTINAVPFIMMMLSAMVVAGAVVVWIKQGRDEKKYLARCAELNKQSICDSQDKK